MMGKQNLQSNGYYLYSTFIPGFLPAWKEIYLIF